MVERNRMSCEGERKMRQIMCMNLRLICSCAHSPFSIIAHSYTIAGFFELEVLEELDSIGVFGVIIQACRFRLRASQSGRGVPWMRPR